VSIGSTSVKSNPAVIDSLIIGDRDALFLATVKATYGDTREYQINCPHCRGSNDVLINLNEFPNRDVSINPKEQIKIFLKDGTVQKFNLVTGSDSQHVSKLAKSIPEQNTMLIARCADWEGGEKPADTMVWAKKLGMKDRAKIIDALLEAQPGPEIKEVDAHCAHCEKPFPIMLNWASLLFG
jgi:thiol-disulfide isomerase/thioredoxin